MKIVHRFINFFLNLLRIKNNTISRYVFYRIIDFTNHSKFALQCINSKAIFYLKLAEIVLDIDILNALHPSQACYIGLEYAENIDKLNDDILLQNKNLNKCFSHHRYGCYELCYQDRNGNICYINKLNNREYIMDPRDIAFTEELIKNFDASQAFYIGVYAGMKLNSLSNQNRYEKFSYAEDDSDELRLVK